MAINTFLMIIIASSLIGCASKTPFRSACATETDAAWKALDSAQADGFGETMSYAKALSLLTAAHTMQTAENFDNCYRHAKDAGFYIRESRKDQ